MQKEYDSKMREYFLVIKFRQLQLYQSDFEKEK
jgi:hypothetical protein